MSDLKLWFKKWVLDYYNYLTWHDELKISYSWVLKVIAMHQRNVKILLLISVVLLNLIGPFFLIFELLINRLSFNSTRGGVGGGRFIKLISCLVTQVRIDEIRKPSNSWSLQYLHFLWFHCLGSAQFKAELPVPVKN